MYDRGILSVGRRRKRKNDMGVDCGDDCKNLGGIQTTNERDAKETLSETRDAGIQSECFSGTC